MRDLTTAGYLLCLAAAIVLAIASARPTSRIGSVGGMLDRVLARRAPRVTLVLFWWWIGWHFLVARTVDPPLG